MAVSARRSLTLVDESFGQSDDAEKTAGESELQSAPKASRGFVRRWRFDPERGHVVAVWVRRAD